MYNIWCVCVNAGYALPGERLTSCRTGFCCQLNLILELLTQCIRGRRRHRHRRCRRADAATPTARAGAGSAGSSARPLRALASSGSAPSCRPRRTAARRAVSGGSRASLERQLGASHIQLGGRQLGGDDSPKSILTGELGRPLGLPGLALPLRCGEILPLTACGDRGCASSTSSMSEGDQRADLPTAYPACAACGSVLSVSSCPLAS